MDLEQFNRLAARTMLRPRSIEAARRVLVGGETGADVARSVGVSKQQVSLWCKSILRARWHGKRYPITWKTVTVTVPPALADKIRALATAARGAELPQVGRPPKKRGRPRKYFPDEPIEAPQAPPDVLSAAETARRLLAGLSAQQKPAEEDSGAT